jgi:transcriptional regulator with XRE-family HTH domain
MPAKKLRKKYRHVLIYARQVLGLSQAELASLIGMSTNTLQSVELGRLPLSERFAFKLSEQLGISARWLLNNQLGNPPPNPVEMRKAFEERQTNPWGTAHMTSYTAHLVPRMVLFRYYVLAREIANELAESGHNGSGFTKALLEFNHALHACLPDNYVRRKVYEKVRLLVKEPEKVFKLVISDAMEMRRAFRENKAKNEPASKGFAEQLMRSEGIRLNMQPKATKNGG